LNAFVRTRSDLTPDVHRFEFGNGGKDVWSERDIIGGKEHAHCVERIFHPWWEGDHEHGFLAAIRLRVPT
jgi:hypothetical protein